MLQRAFKISIVFSVFMTIAFFAANSAMAIQGAVASNGVSVDASRIGDASHFEFGGTSDWKYDLRRDAASGNVTLRLPAMKSEAIAKLRGHSDGLIKNVTINEKGVDGTTELTFAVSANADFFDYLTEQPARLVVDFFPKDAASKEKAPAKKVPAEKSAETKPPAKRSVASTEGDEEGDDEDEADPAGAVRDITAEITGVAKPKKTKPGSGKTDESDMVVATAQAPSKAEEISSQKDFSHGIFDGGDPEFNRFGVKDYEIREEAIIASRSNFYLPFPMLDLGNQQLKNLIGAPPSYEIIPNDTRENKEARIILGLFKDGKRALFLTTSAEFLKKFPQSQYDEIIRYLMADTHESMWREKNSVADFENAMSQYQLLTEKYPNSAISARTLLYMGYAYVERGDSFGALKAFQRFLRLHPESKHVDRVNISVAEAYLKLNSFDDTFALLDQI
ncbi:MAG: outer membrane protein assembly factor BamD, partial [Bdellovibrionota bacterium]